MSGSLEGKVALVSGAARGQGRSHAVRMAEEGADIIGFDVCRDVASVQYSMATSTDLDETAKVVEALGRSIVTCQADVRDLEEVRGVLLEGVRELGRIDIVVANAGIAPIDPEIHLWEISQARWDDVMDINVKGVWHTISAAVPAMIEQGDGGSIVITSSTGGLKGLAYLGDYAASKHAVVGLMRSFAVELAPFSIRVNTVHPAGVRTPMIMNPIMEEFLARSAGPKELRNLLPVEVVEPEDVSNAVVYLASDAARYVTGSVLPVDAGVLAR